ncbi:Down syndrome cell adhesion molecule-like protein Dscam2 isoform X1 [Centruroides sculpturatus]|uniref:Down syndrome cell adhesion molecule-like protein Dscam2 isoform X1 n=1 Tax=Centruroides sculpturatus TaxID=218467 RepID=UPI000C6D0911|nr:Down syndrome cell adhesion molecule-like protein Dscam2 isoform X1 [Centruroides sculpturatus]
MSVFLVWLVISTAKATANLTGPSLDYEPPFKVHFDNNTGTAVRCSAQGTPKPTIHWERSDLNSRVQDIPGLRLIRPDGSMIFPPFSSSNYRRDIHDTIYRCIATNRVGSIGSRDVHVKAIVLRSYKVTARDAEFIIRGNTAVLKCDISSFSRDYVLVTSWYRDDGLSISIKDNTGKYAAFPTGELHIRQASDLDAARKYRCQVHDKLSRSTRNSDRWANIILTTPHGQVPPRMTHWIREAEALEGEALWLPCSASGSPVPTYRWYKKNAATIIPLSHNHRYVITQGTLILHHAILSDSGQYVCTVNNSVGEQQVQTNVIIRAPLKCNIVIPEQIITVGSSITLSCDVVGSPVHFLQWRRNMKIIRTDNRIKQHNNNVLHITAVRPEDQGMYQCFINNNKDSAQCSASLTIRADSPRLVDKFEKQILHPGMSTSLYCRATGHPLPVITWTADDEVIPTSGRIRQGDFVTTDGIIHSYLNLSKVEVQDGRTFTCKAQSEFGTTSHSANINVLGPPVARPTTNKTVLAGETMSLRCPVSGYPIVSYVWEKDGRKLPTSHRHELRSDGQLIIHDVDRKTDSGMWWCTASDENGQKARGRIFIHVVASPVIDPFSFPSQLQEGGRTSIHCFVSAGDPPITIRWMKDGESLRPDILGISMELYNPYTSNLFFEKVNEKHNGNYTCVAFNPYSRTNYTAEMLVQIPPRWKIEPEDASVVQGNSVRFDCQADGYPRPVIRWKKLTGPPSEGFQTIMSNARMQVLENGSLYFQDTIDSDAGSFLCQAFNGIGAGLSKVMKLTVHVPAYFITISYSKKVKKGDSVSMECTAKGDKPLTIVWLKDGKQLNNNTITRYNERHFEKDGGSTSVLTLHNVEREDSSVFTCLSSNPYGNDRTTVDLTVQEPPDNPGHVDLIRVTSRTITIRWPRPFDGNSPIIRYLVEVELVKDNKGLGKFLATEVPGSQLETVVRGLSPLATYNVYVIAENSFGQSEASHPLIITTDAEVPRLPPRDVKATAIDSRTIRVSWKPPISEVDGRDFTGYYVGFKKLNSKDSYIFKTFQVTNKQKEQYLLSNLQSSTKYEIVVQVFNDKGAGPESEKIVAETMKEEYSHPVSLKIVLTTLTTIQVAWDSKSTNDGYVLYLRQGDGSWTETSVPVGRTSYTFTNLRCGSVHQLYIVAQNKTKKGKPSEIITTRTKGSLPKAPSNKAFLIINSTSVTAILSTWDNGGCPISSYILKYRSSIDKEWKTISDDISSIKSKISITGLSSGEKYYILCGARNSAGYTETEYEFETKKLDTEHNKKSVPEASTTDLQRKVAVITSTVCSGAVLIVILAAACAILNRRRRQRREPHDVIADRRNVEASKSEGLAMNVWEKRRKSDTRNSQGREPLYLPCPYAAERLYQLSIDGDSDMPSNGATGTINDHSYDVPIQLMSKSH